MKTHNILLATALTFLLIGCNDPGKTDPIVADPAIPPSTDDSYITVNSADSNRIFFGFWTISVSDNHEIVEVEPFRSVDMHLNILKLLEGGLCDDCLTISNVEIPEPGEIWFDMTIKHPFEDNLNLTCFDPRGIFISDADYMFPISGRSVSLDSSNIRILNPDGYTSLFNAIEFPEDSQLPPVLKYWTGKFSTGGIMTATLNPFIAYSQNQPRRMFLPGSEVTRTVVLGFPLGPFKFGYAIDVSWEPPVGEVNDPETDFPQEANCLEAFKIVLDIPQPLTNIPGDTTPAYVEVFDHQGLDGIVDVTLEIPELGGSLVPFSFSHATGENSWLFEGIINNEAGAVTGEYPILIKVEENDQDPVAGILNAYDIALLEIIESKIPVALAGFEPSPQYMNGPVHFFDDGSYDPDGGTIVTYEWDWENDGVFDEEGIDVIHSWSLPGIYQVQFRVTDDEGSTAELAEPMEVEIINTGTEFTDVTPDGLNAGRSMIFSEGECLAVTRNDGFDFYNISDPVRPVWVSRVLGIYTGYPNQTVIRDGYMYVAGGFGDHYEIQNALVIIDVADVSTPEVVNIVDLESVAYGYPVSIALKDNYAYIGNMNWWGLILVNIETPESAFVENVLELGVYFSSIEFYEDLTIVGQDGLNFQPCLQIWDIDPTGEATYINGVNAMSIFGIEASNGYAYTWGGSNDIFDIDPIEDAYLVTEIPNLGWFSLEVEGNYLFGTVSNGWGIYDIDPPEDVNLFKTIELSGTNIFTTLLGGYAYVCADMGLYVIDIDPVEQAEIVDVQFTTWGFSSDIEKSADILYLSSASFPGSWADGYLQAVDVSDPENPEAYLNAELSHSINEFEISSGFAFAVGEGALQVIDISMPGQEYTAAELPISSESYDIDLDGDFAYVVNDQGFMVCNISDPLSPSLEAQVPMIGIPMMVEVEDGFAYIGVFIDPYTTDFAVFDISDSINVHEVNRIHIAGTLNTYHHMGSIALVGLHVLVSAGDVLNIVNIETPESPDLVNVMNLMTGEAYEIHVAGNLAYLIGELGLRVLDISDPGEPYVVMYDESVIGRGMVLDPDFMYTTWFGLKIYQVI